MCHVNDDKTHDGDPVAHPGFVLAPSAAGVMILKKTHVAPVENIIAPTFNQFTPTLLPNAEALVVPQAAVQKKGEMKSKGHMVTLHPQVAHVVLSFLEFVDQKLYRCPCKTMKKVVDAFYQDQCYEYLYSLFQFGSLHSKLMNPETMPKVPASTILVFFSRVGSGESHEHMLQQLQYALKRQVMTRSTFDVAGCQIFDTRALAIVTPDSDKFKNCVHFYNANRQPLLTVGSGPSLTSPESSRNVELVLPRGMTRLPNCVYRSCWGLDSVTIQNAEQLTVIGHRFCEDSSVKSIDVSTWINVTHLGRLFMSKSRVAVVDLSPMTQLEQIGNGFMAKCESLWRVKLHDLQRVKVVREWFCNRCPITEFNMDKESCSQELQAAVKRYHDIQEQRERRSRGW